MIARKQEEARLCARNHSWKKKRPSNLKHIPGVSKKMNDSEIILLGAFRDCFLLTMILGTLI